MSKTEAIVIQIGITGEPEFAGERPDFRVAARLLRPGVIHPVSQRQMARFHRESPRAYLSRNHFVGTRPAVATKVIAAVQ